MSLHTPLNDLLGIKHPIMLAGMAGPARSELVAAVSEAGGYGTMGCLTYCQDLDALRAELKAIRKRTKKPFGVDFALSENFISQAQTDACIDVIIEEGASCFVAALRAPEPYQIKRLQEAGLLVATMCGKVRHAKKAVDAGCDFVIAQGHGAGGHTGKIDGMSLIPHMVSALDVPVVAAGGIFDGRGLVASLAFGAVGAWVGTRFLASKEAFCAPEYKQHVLDVKEGDETIVTRAQTSKPCRMIQNSFTDQYHQRAEELKGFVPESLEEIKVNYKKTHRFTKDHFSGYDPDRQAMLAGQCSGAIDTILSSQDIIDDMVLEAVSLLKKMPQFTQTFSSKLDRKLKKETKHS